MNQHTAVFPESRPLPAQLSENLRHISRKLNERGFVLRKRRAYMIEVMDTRTPRRSMRP